MKATTLRRGFISSAVALALVGSLGTITPAFATGVICGPPGPLCRASVSLPNGNTIDLPLIVDRNTGIARLPAAFTQTGPLFSATINSLTLNPDPAIIFSASFSNLSGVTLPFILSFTVPIALNGTISANSSIGYTLTDGFPAGLGGAAGVTLSPLTDPTHILTAFDTPPVVNKGVDVGPFFTDPPGVLCTAFTPGPAATSNCGPYSAANTFSGGPFTAMIATLAFQLSPEDTAGFSGAVVQTQVVPEPATLLLLGGGLLGLVGGWRRYSFRA